MKHVIYFLSGTMIFILTIMLLLTMSRKNASDVELADNVHHVLETTVQNVLDEKKSDYSIESKEEFIADFTESLLVTIDTASDIEVTVYEYDPVAGILSVKVVEKYKEPDGSIGTAECISTAILDYEVKDSLPDQITVKMLKNDGSIFKTLTVRSGTKIAYPGSPAGNAYEKGEWKFKNDNSIVDWGDEADDDSGLLITSDMANVTTVKNADGSSSKVLNLIYRTSSNIRYAVAIYGIGQDVDIDGNAMGLTFGPAVGGDYINSYKSHIPSGNTMEGNAHRCLHDDDWGTIISWNRKDPYVYEQCITEGCTHSVELDFANTSTLVNTNFNVTYQGDGASALRYELNTGTWENLRWNPTNGQYGTPEGGWGASRIRAMLNGADGLTNTSIDNYCKEGVNDPNKSASIYTSDNCLLNAFPDELKNAIGARATKYDSVYDSKTAENVKTTFDKLWLFSPSEIADKTAASWKSHPLEGKVYTKMIGTGDASIANTNRIAYYVSSSSGGAVSSISHWWLRSTCTYGSALCVSGNGGVQYDDVSKNNGMSPGFALKR